MPHFQTHPYSIDSIDYIAVISHIITILKSFAHRRCHKGYSSVSLGVVHVLCARAQVESTVRCSFHTSACKHFATHVCLFFLFLFLFLFFFFFFFLLLMVLFFLLLLLLLSLSLLLPLQLCSQSRSGRKSSIMWRFRFFC